MHRLFVAIDLPPDVKDQLESLCSGVTGAKWVKREQMHLTLRFIGEVETGVYKTVQSGLKQAQGKPFALGLRGVGQFPPRGAPRVLWVGLTAPPELNHLYRQVESILTGLGLPPEDRPFSPHITLARLKSPPPPEAVRQFLQRQAAFEIPAIPVTAFTLYSSVLAPQGPTYHIEGQYPLN